MLRMRKPIPGESPGTLRLREEIVRRQPVIKLIEYDRAHLEERVIEDREELLSHLDNQRVTWINIDGLGDIEVLRVLGSQFNLHPLALEDVLDTTQRPKVEQYDNYLFIVAHMIYRDQTREMCGEQVSMFLGKHFLITLQEEAEFDVFEPVRVRIRSGNGTIRKMGPDYLAYALLDSIVDHYYPVLEDVGAKIDLIEEGLVELQPGVSPVGELHGHKRSLARIRRFIWPVRDLLSFLMHDEGGLVTKATKVYLRDCYDHTVQLMDLVESYRDVLSGLMELYLSSGWHPDERDHARPYGHLVRVHSAYFHRRGLRNEFPTGSGREETAVEHAGALLPVRLRHLPSLHAGRGDFSDRLFQEKTLAVEKL